MTAAHTCDESCRELTRRATLLLRWLRDGGQSPSEIAMSLAAAVVVLASAQPDPRTCLGLSIDYLQSQLAAMPPNPERQS